MANPFDQFDGEAPLSFKRESDLARAVKFTPAEQADINRQESMPAVSAELDRAIAQAKDPKVKAILVAEKQNRAATASNPFDAFDGGAPTTPAPAPKAAWAHRSPRDNR